MDATIPSKIAHGQSQSVYVLSADGSQLYLLDPSRPSNGEHPPPYAPPIEDQRAGSRARASTISSHASRSPTRSLRPLLPVRGVSDAGPGQGPISSPERSPIEIIDERTPLLPREPAQRPRWRTIFARQNSEISQAPRRSAMTRYWSKLASGRHWGAAFHLLVLNFPFALLIWPFLVAGTLAGTALLITLPIGALVWFITLLLTRTSARIEMAMQRYYHEQDSPRATRPIFKRLKEQPSTRSPRSGVISLPSHQLEPEWEGSIAKNAVAMFSDHYSYQALSYLILTKALITLVLTILLWPVFVISLVTLLPLPGFLILVKRIGRWQAGIAREALA